MKKIKVSTITPCFKMEKYLKLFLDELPKQSMFNEMEVVLDHNEPTEQETIWVREFQEKYPNRLKHIITNPVVPIGVSMNKCIQESSGEYLCIWNVDDLRTPTSLETQSKILEQGYDISHGNFVITKTFGGNSGEFVDHAKYGSINKEYTRGMILGPFFMFEKELLNKSGLFDEQLKSGADFDLAIRLAIHGKIGVTNKILGYYLNEGKGASTNGDGRQPTERTVIELRYGILDKINNLYVNSAKTKYNIENLLINNSLIHVSNFVADYEEFIKNNGFIKT